MNEIQLMAEITGRPMTYLGDAVYASFDGYQIWLHTSNGISITNNIALEPAVFEALLRFRKVLNERTDQESS